MCIADIAKKTDVFVLHSPPLVRDKKSRPSALTDGLFLHSIPLSVALFADGYALLRTFPFSLFGYADRL